MSQFTYDNNEKDVLKKHIFIDKIKDVHLQNFSLGDLKLKEFGES